MTPPGPDNRLTLQATTTTLPINAFNVQPFVGSPFMSEVTVTVRTSSGQAVNMPDGIQVSINPVGSTGGFSTLDDPTTTDINEFTNRLGQGPVDVVAGKATLFVHSFNLTGTTTLTVTTVDPDTTQTVTSTLVFNIVSSIPNLPASVFISPPLSSIYAQGSGGNVSTQVEIYVADGIGQPVPNPTAGNNAFNNVRLELTGEAAAGGARVSGTNAQGQNVQGTAVSLRTLAGISGALVTSGTTTGSMQFRVTADRADNNVDNGISDPVFAEQTIVVSDGVPFDIEITQPIVNVIDVLPLGPNPPNPADWAITSFFSPLVNIEQNTPITVPLRPDGAYSMTVGVVVTDRLGNPPLPGTVVRFGLIDEPQVTGLGDFLISGPDGNPQEAGTTFTAPTGRFTTAGGGIGPNDTLVVFGENTAGNRDLESARTVSRVNSATNLTTQSPFNRNDTTGSIVDSGAVLNYVAGRAADGNIIATATTDARGNAVTQMKYPVTKLGKRAIVWAATSGRLVAGNQNQVTDAELLVFAGLAPPFLSVSATSIPGNTTTDLTVCVTDALAVPVRGLPISFRFRDLNGGVGRVNGVEFSGSTTALSDNNGCGTVSVFTSGLLANAGLDFSVGGQVAPVQIVVGAQVLIATPNLIISDNGGLTTLRLMDSSGRPIPGVQLVGTCTTTNGAIATTVPDPNGGTGITNANGESRWIITGSNFSQVNGFGTAICTYTTVTGSPTAVVTARGTDRCAIPISPPFPGCTGLQTLTLTGNTSAPFQAISTPVGISCTFPATSCTGQFPQNTIVDIQANRSTSTTSMASLVPVITGSCVEVVGTKTNNSVVVQVQMNGARACNIAFPAAP
ncbi:MAG: hypothetical protein ACT4NL_07160 [Pseudomarimonas sp.]